MSAWVNPDDAPLAGGTGFMDILDTAVKSGAAYLIADKTGAVPTGYTKIQNVGATPKQVDNSPSMFGANSVFHGVDMRYVAGGFAVLLIIGLILRK